MIKRILNMRRLKVPWPWLKGYRWIVCTGNNRILWWEFWGSKLSADTRYVNCPGCAVKIDLEGEGSWRRDDGPCEDFNYWCMDKGCNPPYTCGCVLEYEDDYLEGITKGFREDGQ